MGYDSTCLQEVGGVHQEISGWKAAYDRGAVRRLESIGFAWERYASWDEQFEQLHEYKKKVGDCPVPLMYSPNPKLGRWVTKQRQAYDLYQEGKPSCMTAEHVQELESIDFVWDPLATAWIERFEQLREFKVQFGHCIVPLKYPADPKVGIWAANQRRKFKEGNPNVCTPESIQALQSIGFDSDVKVKAPDWNERFEQFRKFKKQFGDCFVSQDYFADPKLGKWVANQRQNYKLYQEGQASDLKTERVRKLKSVGFGSKRFLKKSGSDPKAPDWNERFEQLSEYKEQFGHCKVPREYSADPKLGKWVTNQRQNYKLYQEGQGKHITAKRARRLESIGFVQRRK